MQSQNQISKQGRTERVAPVRLHGVVRAKKENPWVEWVCPYCNAVVSDPASIKETSCGNGHIVYLGKSHESRYGYSRRAYKTRSERAREERKDKIMHETYMQIMSGAFRPNDELSDVRGARSLK